MAFGDIWDDLLEIGTTTCGDIYLHDGLITQ